MEEYRVQVCSDVDYDNLIAEIYVEGRILLLISREDPDEDFQVEIPGSALSEDAVVRRVPLGTLMAAIDDARTRLQART